MPHAFDSNGEPPPALKQTARHPLDPPDNSPYAYTMSERLTPQDDRVTLVTNVRLVCDATRPVTSQQPTVGNVTAVDWKPVNP